MTRSIVVLMTVAGLTLTVCGGVQSPGQGAAAAMPARTAGRAALVRTRAAVGDAGAAVDEAPFDAFANPADAQFIDAMIPQHESAIELGMEAITKGEHPELREFAQSLVTTQLAEVGQMKAWRAAWYEDLPLAVDTHVPRGLPLDTSMDMSMPLDIPLDMTMAASLAPDDSRPFDLRFIDALIPHHENSVARATRALTQAEHSEIRTLAARIVTAQRAGIRQLEGWRATWYSQDRLNSRD